MSNGEQSIEQLVHKILKDTLKRRGERNRVQNIRC